MESFHAFSEQKTHETFAAQLLPLKTIEDHSANFATDQIGNTWTREYYDGPFHLVSAGTLLPSVSLVFVQSKEGNTAADNPEELGGGPVDKHLITPIVRKQSLDAEYPILFEQLAIDRAL